MIKNTLKKIKTKIQRDRSVAEENKTELLSLLSKLESEITKISKMILNMRKALLVSSNDLRMKSRGGKKSGIT